MAAWILNRRRSMKKGGHRCPPRTSRRRQILGVQDSHDLIRPRIHHYDLVVDQHEFIAAPFRINRHDLPRKRVESHFARNAGADRDREVHVVQRLNMLVPNHRGDLGALLGRELCPSASLSDSRLGPATLSRLGLGRRLRPAVRRALLIVGVLAFAALGLHVLAAFAAFGFHVLAAFAAFSLHVLAALGAVALRAHALRLLTLHVLIVSALVLGRARGLLVRLRSLHPGRRAWSSGTAAVTRRCRVPGGRRALLNA